jgi:hypothetical protein
MGRPTVTGRPMAIGRPTEIERPSGMGKQKVMLMQMGIWMVWPSVMGMLEGMVKMMGQEKAKGWEANKR